jgi:hypothetical protein
MDLKSIFIKSSVSRVRLSGQRCCAFRLIRMKVNVLFISTPQRCGGGAAALAWRRVRAISLSAGFTVPGAAGTSDTRGFAQLAPARQRSPSSRALTRAPPLAHARRCSAIANPVRRRGAVSRRCDHAVITAAREAREAIALRVIAIVRGVCAPRCSRYPRRTPAQGMRNALTVEP